MLSTTIHEAALRAIPGGDSLISWFGRAHRFHDAEFLQLKLVANGVSTLTLHTWQMTDAVDDRGYFIVDKHCVVTMTLHEVTQITLRDFDLTGIVSDLTVEVVDDGFQLVWESSYGVEGSIGAKQISIELRPGKP